MTVTPTIHLGAPTAVVPLTVFPVWTDAPMPRPRLRTGLPRGARVGEVDEGSEVPRLTVTNPTRDAFLLTGGTLLAGGWQSRVLVHSVLVGADTRLDVDVRCVEQGRWGGGRTNRVDRARAPLAVRGALRGIASDGRPAEAVGADPAGQGDVWGRVARYEAALAPSPTSSLVDVASTVADDAFGVGEVEALPGQRGVLVGVAGHPALLEVFADPSGLRRELGGILRGALLDAALVPPVPTPGRRARAFATRVSGRELTPGLPAGAARRCGARDDLVDVEGVVAEAEQILHLSALNVRHDLVGAS